MRVTVTPAEEDIIRRALAFANLAGLKAPDQAARLLGEATIVRLGGKFAPGNSVEEDRGVQVELIAALDAISSGNEPRRAEVRKRAFAELGKLADYQFVVDTKGELHMAAAFKLDTPRAGCWYAIGFILDADRGLTDRLGRCGAPGCGRFHLKFAGRPQRHCSPEHRKRYDESRAADRVRRWREKKRKAARRR